jgi:HK97 family phage prohead protease
MNKEIRTYKTNFSFRKLDDKEVYIVEGYAAIYNQLSDDLGGFNELIESGAFTQELINNSDIFCVLNHNESKGVLARSQNGQGSLKLSIDEIGLKYSFELPNSPVGLELKSNLERGEITSSSFAFSIDESDPEAEQWVNNGDGTYKRIIKKFNALYDVSPVYIPSYNDTTVGIKQLRNKIDNSNQLNEIIEKDNKNKLKKYYAEIRKKYIKK